MRTSKPRLSLYLKTSKPNSRGLCMIMLRCAWKGSVVDKSTGISCLPTHWNAHGRCLKGNVLNSKVINLQLQRLLLDYEQRVHSFMLSGMSFTSRDVIYGSSNMGMNVRDVSYLIDQYLDENHLQPQSLIAWRALKSNLRLYNGDGILIDSIDQGFVKGFTKHLEHKKYNDGTIRLYLSKFRALCRWCCSKGLMVADPFIGFNYTRKYKASSRHQNLNIKTVDAIIRYFMLHVNDEGFRERFLDIRSEEFALSLWLCGYVFNGAAPVDLLQIRIEDFVVKQIDGCEFLAYDGKRSKTRVPFVVRLRRGVGVIETLLSLLINGRDSGWLFPQMYELGDSMKMVAKIVRYVQEPLSRLFKHINEFIDTEGIDCDLIPDGFSLYSYRHSFAMCYIAKGGNIAALATLMGRSIDTMSSYITQLTYEGDLANAVSVLGL